MINVYVYLAVIVSGASVLAIELLGTRIIAPFYGASIYLWSALISVTLAALAVGYWIGGKWADRGPTLNRLCFVLGLAGLWILVIPWLAAPLMAITEPIGLRAAVLVTATVLFFPPLALLGVISPYAIRMKASSLEMVGRTAGNLYAVSTVASVVAAVAIGFFLIPNVGVYRLVFLIGLMLIATALVGYVNKRKLKGTLAGMLILVAAIVLGVQVAPAQAIDPENGVIAIEQSAYAEIRVVDKDEVRYMLIDGGMHSSADTATWKSTFPYANVLEILKRFFDQPGRLLLVGLGGGSVVKNYAREGWRVEAVEIDPVVTRMARQYFGLKEAEAQVYDMDGRQFLMTSDRTYDVVVMDAFGSSYIPFHLVTEEAVGLIRSRMAPQGVLAMNIWAVGWHDEMVASLSATLRRHFQHVVALPIAEPPDQFGNLILLASNRKLELLEELPVPKDRFSGEYDRAHAWDNRFEENVAGATVLTDDLNPIDLWAERVNLAARKQLHAFLDKHGVAW